MNRNNARYVGAIDQGTTGTRFMLFDRQGRVAASAYKEHKQIFPKPGWVEHDAEEIWRNAQQVMVEAMSKAKANLSHLAAIGITNQRETTLLWEIKTGRPIHNAIVWQDRRTADRCQRLEMDGGTSLLRRKTGLPTDPYFSATKIQWLLDNVHEARRRSEKGEILFGNIDAWLIWNLTGRHVTDATNASRTLLFNLEEMQWDDEILSIFDVPIQLLPEVHPSSEVYGSLDLKRCKILADGLGHNEPTCAVPVSGDLGDQQAALFGQAGFAPGDAKNTYGTGSFLLRNTGKTPVMSHHGLLTTVGYLMGDKTVCYALEGSVFITGAAVQWLRDGLGLIDSAAQTEALASSASDTGGVYFVPAFAGLGAPYWNPYARGTMVGLTRGTTKAQLVRAILEAIAYQSRDVVEAMEADAASVSSSQAAGTLKVDGGAVKNNFLCQFQSDILGLPVSRPKVAETTALGAAYAAGLAVGFWSGLDEIKILCRPDRSFEPRMSAEERETLYKGWKKAVRCALSWAEDRK